MTTQYDNWFYDNVDNVINAMLKLKEIMPSTYDTYVTKEQKDSVKELDYWLGHA